MNKKILINIVFVGLIFSMPVLGQKEITLEQAVKIALDNNLLIKNEQLRTEYHRMLIQSSKNIPLTQISGEFGQINSRYGDLGFGIAQSFNMPKVYSAQKDLFTEEWKSSTLQKEMQEAELKKKVSLVFNSLIYLQQKQQLLNKNEEIFGEFLKKSALRIEKGESNILEKTMAENQLGQIRLQLKQVKQDEKLFQLQFGLLLNTSETFIPHKNEDFIATGMINQQYEQHPSLKIWKQNQQIAEAQTKVEESKLLPEINLGYNLIGIRGTGADERYYNAVPRFQSAQIGLNIPIFNQSGKARINAAKTVEHMARQEYELNRKQFENAFQSAMTEYRKYEEMVEYFENFSLKNAKIITETANDRFANGAIDYLEWVLLLNQAIEIQNDYLKALFNKNNAWIELSFYTNN